MNINTIIGPLSVESFRLAMGLPYSGEEENEKETERLMSALALAREVILAYCNVEEIPDGLWHTAYEMAAEVYRRRYGDETEGETEKANGMPLSGVSSIKVGDVSVTLGTAEAEAAYKASLLGAYKPRLQRYRRVTFV